MSPDNSIKIKNQLKQLGEVHNQYFFEAAISDLILINVELISKMMIWLYKSMKVFKKVKKYVLLRTLFWSNFSL